MGVSMQRYSVSGCQKMDSGTKCYLSNTIERLNVFVDVNVGIKNHNFNFPLILDKYNIMIVMQNENLLKNFLLLSM